MITVSGLFFGILFFILGIILVIWGADATLDGIEEISKRFNFSPILFAILLLGIDLEELVSSIIAAINGKTETAIGNVIGNTIISISLILALPGLFYLVNLRKINLRIIPLFWTTNIIILLSLIFPIPIWIMGIFSLFLYCSYVYLIIHDEKKNKLATIGFKSDFFNQDKNSGTDEHPIKNKQNEEVDTGTEKEEKFGRLIIKTILGLVALSGGAELLGRGLESILTLTNITDSFMGLLIIAAATNAEEFIILFSSIKKKRVEIGLNALIGKLIWNTGLNFAISSFIIQQITQVSSMIFYNCLLLVVVLVPLFSWIVIKKKEMNKSTSFLLLLIFVIFLVITFLTQFL
ncbi:MAG: sodium:calcium antiporter [Candidatus Heimdallarchaeota archaeon]|nr:sodium:calcium antiporter [Candidatus Heimdallarchaeota archaeon]